MHVFFTFFVNLFFGTAKALAIPKLAGWIRNRLGRFSTLGEIAETIPSRCVPQNSAWIGKCALDANAALAQNAVGRSALMRFVVKTNELVPEGRYLNIRRIAAVDINNSHKKIKICLNAYFDEPNKRSADALPAQLVGSEISVLGIVNRADIEHQVLWVDMLHCNLVG